jgi:hypothetical protein
VVSKDRKGHHQEHYQFRESINKKDIVDNYIIIILICITNLNTIKTKKTMTIFEFTLYTLMLSYNPCDVFKHFNVTEMHGLNLADCEKYNNTNEDAYIAGLSNVSPIDNKPFVFINLSRCTDDIATTGLTFHEMMHLSLDLHNNDLSKEEEIITWAELESYKVLKLIKKQ